MTVTALRTKGLITGLLLMTAGLPLAAQQLLPDRFLTSMKEDLQILATDSLEGREAGSMGELYAALYIADRFERLGIKPWFGICYYQDFDFADGKEYTSASNYLKVVPGSGTASSPLSIGPDGITPLQWGADGTITAEVVQAGFCLPAMAATARKGKKGKTETQQEPDLKGKIALIRYDAPPGYDAAEGISKVMADKVKHAGTLGAAGVLFYDPAGVVTMAPGQYFIQDKFEIPVVFMLNGREANALASKTVELSVASAPKKSYGKNVAGYIDNGADKTVIIGAHYDHLGWGHYNSRHTGLPAIHYGADDNASGVAGMLALAEWLTMGNLTGRNYLFIAFSAEEKGLLGSKVFTGHPDFNPEKYLCMLNFDMIGRVKPDESVISLLAAGSSPKWQEIIPLVKEDVKAEAVQGGTNGSDHYHFYAKQIPVLFFFNGIHDDYHKPTDVVEKINFKGMRDAVEYSAGLLRILDTISDLPFSEVPAENQGGSRRAGKISLGIVPAHGVEADGVGVQEVLPGKPAALAGIEKGDVIIRVAGKEIHDITDYMKALGEISEGQKVKVQVARGNRKKTFALQF
ncbi:MAG TPA: M28 family peptidase [Bacteroidales bacterium]|nr:M28 family peptidase [Bacteroidales bacterium]HRZ48603.1 M28 family peptidase [Bacteroidales bacterium]